MRCGVTLQPGVPTGRRQVMTEMRYETVGYALKFAQIWRFGARTLKMRRLIHKWNYIQ